MTQTSLVHRVKRSATVFVAFSLIVLPILFYLSRTFGENIAQDSYGFLLNVSIGVLYIAFFAAVTAWFDSIGFTQIGVTSFICATVGTAMVAFVFIGERHFSELTSIGRLAPALLIPTWLFGTIAIWLARRVPALRTLMDTPLTDTAP